VCNNAGIEILKHAHVSFKLPSAGIS